MAFCTQCGSQLTQDAKFCHSCGDKVTRTSSPPRESAPEEKYEPYASFGDHPVSFRSFLAKEKNFKNQIKGLEYNLPESLEEKLSAIPIRGEKANPFFVNQLDSYENSSKRDKWMKTPLMIFTEFYPDGVLGAFRLANNGKGITQDQKFDHWTAKGNTDWLFFLESRIVMFNDFVSFDWKNSSHYKTLTYEDIRECNVSSDQWLESGLTSVRTYFYQTLRFLLKNGGSYSRYFHVGIGEDENINNAYKAETLCQFIMWKLRSDIHPETWSMSRGTITDNTYTPKLGYGFFREMGD